MVHPGKQGQEFVWKPPGKTITHHVHSPSLFTLREAGPMPRTTVLDAEFIWEDNVDELEL